MDYDSVDITRKSSTSHLIVNVGYCHQPVYDLPAHYHAKQRALLVAEQLATSFLSKLSLSLDTVPSTAIAGIDLLMSTYRHPLFPSESELPILPATYVTAEWLYTPASGELARVSPEGLNVWEAAWSGSGHVLAITSERPSEDDWYSAVLSRLDISTGEMIELLRSDVQLGLPAGTSDGTRAAVVEAVCSDRWIVAGDLILLDLVAGPGAP